MYGIPAKTASLGRPSHSAVIHTQSLNDQHALSAAHAHTTTRRCLKPAETNHRPFWQKHKLIAALVWAPGYDETIPLCRADERHKTLTLCPPCLVAGQQAHPPAYSTRPSTLPYSLRPDDLLPPAVHPSTYSPTAAICIIKSVLFTLLPSNVTLSPGTVLALYTAADTPAGNVNDPTLGTP